MIQITVNKDGTVSNNRIIIGNKYENNDEVLQFTLPSDYANYSNYVVATIKSRFYNETRLIPIFNNQVKITNSITYFDGTWNLYVMCRSVALDLKGDLTDISARDSEHVFISNAIQAVINKNTIDKDKITMEEVDDTIKIVYDQLIGLIKQQQNVNTTVETNEAARVKAEQGRVSAENTRVTNENTRISNENARKTNETNRQNAETNRASAENSRASAESTRASNETTRQTQENSRVSAEKSRVTAESDRATSENTRVSNENTRKDNETKRVSAENSRIANEKARVLAEEERNKNFDKLKGEVEGDVSGKVDLITQAKNEALAEIKQQESSYQEQIDELQRKNVSQDDQFSQLQEEVDQKVNQPYINNKGKLSVNNSDEGMLRNFEIYGKSEQYSTSGKNLFGITGQTSVNNGITTTFNKDTIVLNGTVSGNANVLSPYYVLFGTFEAGTYHIKSYESGSVTVPSGDFAKYIRTGEGDVNGSALITKTRTQTFDNTITLTSSTKLYLQIYANTSGIIFNNYRIQFQIEKGSIATDYEPYTGGQPSPSPEYPQEIKSVVNPTIKVVGRNLFNCQDYSQLLTAVNNNATSVVKTKDKISYTSVNGTVCGLYILSPNFTKWVTGYDTSKKYYLSAKIKTNVACSFKFGTDTTNSKSIPIGITTMKVYLGLGGAFVMYVNNGVANIEITDIMVSEVDDDFQAYTEQTLTLPTTLRGLPVASDGNVIINGQQYISDYIDVKREKIVRMVMPYKFKDYNWSSMNMYQSNLTESTELVSFRIPISQLPNVKNGGHVIAKKYTSELSKWNVAKTFITITDGVMVVDNYKNFGLSSWSQTGDINPNLENIFGDEEFIAELNEPIEQDLTNEQIKSLQSLKSQYPSTNMFITSDQLDGYGTFDYKLNLKSWIEDKDNEDIDYNPTTEKEKYSESFFANWFALQRTGKVYTVKFPLWETSQSSLGTKLHDNAGLTCVPSTPLVAGKTDYETIPVFRTYDVNAYTDDDGVIHVTAFKGDENFKDTGENDVLVLGTSYYEKYWTEDGYWYYSITDLPRDGYEIAAECKKKNGGIRPFAVYGKYVAGDINGKPYSSKGLIPAYYPFEAISAYHEVDYFRKRGKYYSGGLMWDYKYVTTRFWLKFATLNSQSILGGCANYNYQYVVAKAESNVKRVILSKAQANNLLVGSCVSVGSGGVIDRSNKTAHDIVRNAQITEIVAIDDTNSAVYLDVDKPFTTTSTCAISTMHWLSGYSDQILGRDGSLGKTATDQRYPIVISGIELMVGGYEIPANVMMDIKGSGIVRDVYITNDATKLSTNTTTIMSTWNKSQYQIKGTNANNWNFITAVGIDIKYGGIFPTASGQSGSGTGTGFADGVYFDGNTSGQREFRALGGLWGGGGAGLSCLFADADWSRAGWHCLGRLSLSGVGGA